MKNIIIYNLYLFLLIFSHLPAEELYDPPALYLTWKHRPDTTMTIQWITRNDHAKDTIEYKQTSSLTWIQATGTHQQVPNSPLYLVHRVELSQLQPETDYFFRIGPQGAIYKFRTMPSELKSPIRFAVGGDIYHDSLSYVVEMNQQVARSSPHFVIAGGDLAYSSTRYDFLHFLGFVKEKIDRWLTWLSAWKKTMITPEGYVIPLIPIIGNHEVMGGFDKTPSHAQFFYVLFAMPGPQGYNVLDFNDYMTIILLDSAHTHPIAGNQSQWLWKTLNARKNVLHKFAAYHIPAYPSVRTFDAKYNEQVRKHWVPIFEECNLCAAFEHHEHAYKRTHPLRNNHRDPTGVLYLGDGAYGIAQPRVPKTPTECWYLAKSAAVQHAIIVTLEPNQRKFTAIDSKGNTIDTYTQTIN